MKTHNTAKPGKAEKPQRERFIETGRELGCDEDEAAFEEKLKKIASHKPAKPEPKKR